MKAKERSLPISAPSEGYYVLHYSVVRPSDLSQHSAATVYPVLALLFVLGIWISPLSGSPLVMCLLFLAILVIAGALVFLEVSRPSNIEVSKSGFRVFWLNSLFFCKAPEISWELVRVVSYVEDLQVKGTASTRYYELRFDVSALEPWQRFFLEIMCVTITQSYVEDELTIRLKESGFFHENDQETFRAQLLKYVPTELIGSELLARQEFGEVPAYTALWLGSLHGSMKMPSVLPVGTILAEGRYEIISRLASGGQANVYEARYKANDAPNSDGESCVLKEFVLPERGGSEIQKRAVQHIQREATLLQGLDHPNIVKYRDLFVEGPRAYLVMERIEGTTLRYLIEESGPVDHHRAAELANEMCNLLEYLHNQNPTIIHRDFTPENLMLTPDHRLTLIDFNVAHRLESNSVKTVVGKHAYVPPEQFRGRPTTQSDIYAMGATLFYLLTATDPEPLSKSDPSEVLDNVDMELASLIACCTEPDAEKRCPDIASVRQQLQSRAAPEWGLPNSGV